MIQYSSSKESGEQEETEDGQERDHELKNWETLESLNQERDMTIFMLQKDHSCHSGGGGLKQVEIGGTEARQEMMRM